MAATAHSFFNKFAVSNFLNCSRPSATPGFSLSPLPHKQFPGGLAFRTGSPVVLAPTIKTPASPCFQTFSFQNEHTGREELVFVGQEESVKGLQVQHAFGNMKEIVVLGGTDLAQAQALKLQSSLLEVKPSIKVLLLLLEKGSRFYAEAQELGFTEENGTLAHEIQFIANSDLVLMLNSIVEQVEGYEKVLSHMKPGSILGLPHGFLVEYFQSLGLDFPKNIGVIAVCPKGMAPSVRRMYVQGKEINDAGISHCYAVHQDVDGRATDVALGWAVALGSSLIFSTTMKGILMDAVNGDADSVHGFVGAADLKGKIPFKSISAMEMKGSYPCYTDGGIEFEEANSSHRPRVAMSIKCYDDTDLCIVALPGRFHERYGLPYLVVSVAAAILGSALTIILVHHLPCGTGGIVPLQLRPQKGIANVLGWFRLSLKACFGVKVSLTSAITAFVLSVLSKKFF